MNLIVVIGTQPPCPRCKLLTKVVADKVKELNLETRVKHLTYTDEEAKTFAQKFGLEPGTAKDVAKRLNIEMDLNSLSLITENKEQEQDLEYQKYNDCSWSFELDESLRIYEHKAKNAGIMMTPILIINGELKHNGSVPRLNKIIEWLCELINKN